MLSVKKVIVMLLLLAVLAGAVYGALVFRSRTRQLAQEGEALVAAAQERQQAAIDAFNAIDPNTEAGAQRQQTLENAIVAEALEEAAALEEEAAGLEAPLEEARNKLTALQEDEENAYYLAVYAAYSRGMEKVEAAIEGS